MWAGLWAGMWAGYRYQIPIASAATIVITASSVASPASHPSRGRPAQRGEGSKRAADAASPGGTDMMPGFGPMPVCRLLAWLFGAASILRAEYEAIRNSTYRRCSQVWLQPDEPDAQDRRIRRRIAAHGVAVCSRPVATQGAARSGPTDALTITQERGSGDAVGPLHFP